MIKERTEICNPCILSQESPTVLNKKNTVLKEMAAIRWIVMIIHAYPLNTFYPSKQCSSSKFVLIEYINKIWTSLIRQIKN